MVATPAIGPGTDGAGFDPGTGPGLQFQRRWHAEHRQAGERQVRDRGHRDHRARRPHDDGGSEDPPRLPAGRRIRSGPGGQGRQEGGRPPVAAGQLPRPGGRQVTATILRHGRCCPATHGGVPSGASGALVARAATRVPLLLLLLADLCVAGGRARQSDSRRRIPLQVVDQLLARGDAMVAVYVFHVTGQLGDLLSNGTGANTTLQYITQLLYVVVLGVAATLGTVSGGLEAAELPGAGCVAAAAGALQPGVHTIRVLRCSRCSFSRHSYAA